jgi:hypothetical protein
MNASSVGSTNCILREPESAEVQRSGLDNEGDADDRRAKAVEVSSVQTVIRLPRYAVACATSGRK